jgi:hypothetical protein
MLTSECWEISNMLTCCCVCANRNMINGRNLGDCVDNVEVQVGFVITVKPLFNE